MTKQNIIQAVRCILPGRITEPEKQQESLIFKRSIFLWKARDFSGTNTFFIKSTLCGAFSLYVATTYLLL